MATRDTVTLQPSFQSKSLLTFLSVIIFVSLITLHLTFSNGQSYPISIELFNNNPWAWAVIVSLSAYFITFACYLWKSGLSPYAVSLIVMVAGLLSLTLISPFERLHDIILLFISTGSVICLCLLAYKLQRIELIWGTIACLLVLPAISYFGLFYTESLQIIYLLTGCNLLFYTRLSGGVLLSDLHNRTVPISHIKLIKAICFGLSALSLSLYLSFVTGQKGMMDRSVYNDAVEWEKAGALRKADCIHITNIIRDANPKTGISDHALDYILQHYDEPLINTVKAHESSKMKTMIFLSIIPHYQPQQVPKIYSAACPLLKSNNAYLRFWGIHVLGRIGDTRAIPLIKPLLADKKRITAGEARIVITRLEKDTRRD